MNFAMFENINLRGFIYYKLISNCLDNEHAANLQVITHLQHEWQQSRSLLYILPVVVLSFCVVFIPVNLS